MRLWPRRQGSSLDLLVVGLGNPGREYERNRHNVGHMVVDELARRHGGSWRSKFSGQLAEIRLDGHKVALQKPETFMNESGRAVSAAARFYKLEPGEVLVIHDEGDFDLGRLELKVGRELAEEGRLAEFAEALPTRARVSEAALPIVLASLHERLERPLVCLLAEDADARDAAEAAAWFLGDEAVGYLPGRGVRWESGLE